MKAINTVSLLLIGLLLNVNCYAIDIEVLKEQCNEIGFKIHTPDNGKCVLRLMESAAKQRTKDEAEQRAFQVQQIAKIEETRRENARRRQQNEMLELQRRSIESQEKMVKAQQREAGFELIGKSLEAFSNANRPAPTPKIHIECTTFGNRTTCD